MTKLTCIVHCQDIGERVKTDLHELLGDANSLADKLLLKLTTPDKKEVDPKALVSHDTFVVGSPGTELEFAL